EGFRERIPVTDFDLIIIGGGPAGLTAGLYAARASMKAILLEQKDLGGEILNTELIEDYPGFASITGADLSQKMAEHALKFGLKVETYKPVKEIRSDGDRKIVQLEDGTELRAYAAVVTEIGGNGDVKWIDLDHDGRRERINVEGVFVFIGFRPVGRHLFKDHIDHDKNGYLITDQYMRTSIPGVYAAGDTRAQLAKQITTAVGDATTAVLHAERYIEELKDMERDFPTASREVVAESAGRADLLAFQPGDVILREGDPADRFYMIINGQALATARGRDGALAELGGVLGAVRGLEKDGNLLRSRVASEAVVKLEARHAREADVEDHHVRCDVLGRLEGFRRVGDEHGVVAGLVGNRAG